MRTRDRVRRASCAGLAIFIALTATSCGSVHRSKMAPTVEVASLSGRGAWTILKLRDGTSYVGGELLAATRDSLYLLPDDCPTTGCAVEAFAIRDVNRGRVYKYRPTESVGGWAALGAVSTLSHGVFLVFTLPMWVLSGIAVSQGINRDAEIHLAHDDYDVVDVLPWARFLQGLPEGMRTAHFERPAWFRYEWSESQLEDEGKPVRLRKRYD